jgi:hypothetical protein
MEPTMAKMLTACARPTFVAILAMLSSTAWAQNQPVEKFGWDYECSVDFMKEQPVCTTNALGTKDAVIHPIHDMFLKKEYDKLDRGLKNLVESQRRFFGGESAHEGIAEALKMISWEIPEVAQMADQWHAAVPSSYFAHYAKARAAYDAAWAIRGGGAASSVSGESWAMFRSHLDEAERLLNEAPQELKSLPLWHTLMMGVLSDNSKNEMRVEQIFIDAIDRWPTNFEFYKWRLNRLLPQWGGSWELIDASIRHWTERVEKTEGRSLYARLYIDLLESRNLTPERTLMDWSLMKKSFDDLVRLYPHGGFRLQYAAYSCFARDKKTFLKALESVRAHRDGEPLDGSPWLDGNSFQACMVWSGQCSMGSPCQMHPAAGQAKP